MVQVLPSKIGGAAGFGHALGQGISQQLPKEVEHQRLSSGLRNLAKMPAMSPEQYLAEASSVYGITPEHVHQFGKLAREKSVRGESMGNREQFRPEKPSKPMPEKTVVSKDNKLESPENKAKKYTGIKTPEMTQAQTNPFVRKSNDELYQEQVQLSNDMPQTYRTPQDAQAFVTGREDTREKNYNELINSGNRADKVISNLKTGLDKYIGEEMTKDADLGEIYNNVLNEMETELSNPNNKMSEKQLITKYGAALKDLSKSYDQLKTRSKMWYGNSEYTPDKVKKDIEESRKKFETFGGSEVFKDILSKRFNLTNPMASYFGISRKNKKINEEVNKIKRPMPGDTKSSVEFADKITPLITDEDSLMSYAMKAQSKGLDAKIIIDRLNQNAKSRLFKTDPKHDREMQKGVPSFASLGDLFMAWATDEEDLTE